MVSAVTAWILLFGGAEERLREITWDALKKEGAIISGVVEQDGERSVLKIKSTEAGGKTFSILALEKPGVTRPAYAVRGRVRYEGVEGEGFLEMWNFIGKDKYFSRTLGTQGAAKHLGGSSGWREFVLPFMNRTDASTPHKLEINVVLPGTGTVWLGPLELVQFESGEDPTAAQAPGGWWGDRTAGLVFGSLGGFLGFLGAVVGTLCSLGRGRIVVMALLWGMVFFGIASLLVGVAALIVGQPYAVFYPLLLLGIIDVFVPGILITVAKRRYRDLELRRMSAMDAGGA